jgi:hypothetical protein
MRHHTNNLTILPKGPNLQAHKPTSTVGLQVTERLNHSSFSGINEASSHILLTIKFFADDWIFDIASTANITASCRSTSAQMPPQDNMSPL